MPKAGKSAIPALLRVYETEASWDPSLKQMMYQAFERLSAEAGEAIEPLLKIVDDEAEAEAKRFRALKALGAMGPPALIRLLETENHFLAAVPSVEHAGDPDTTTQLLHDFAELRERGASAGPLVVKFLDSEDWEVRIEAARTLGRIGYRECADELIKLLQRPDDWRLVYSSAESLALLKSEDAISELTELSERHWYSPVRQVALEAIQAIRTGVTLEPKNSLGTYGLSDEHLGDGIDSLNEKEFEELELAAMPPPPDVEVQIKGEDGTARPEKLKGVQVEDGYLIAADHGEWGGYIGFVGADQNLHILREENTQVIYKTRDIIFAVTGLAHMSYDSGFVYQIRKVANGEWQAEKWRALPDAPRASRLLRNGSLFISCGSGIVLVSPTGEMRQLTKPECLRLGR